jgi:hypothetical protein
MAYKQAPGRGNGMKTGGGISSALLQKFTPKEKAAIEKAKKKKSALIEQPANMLVLKN